MTKNTSIVVLLLLTLITLGSILNATTVSRASYPKNFIPFWSQDRGGHETTLLNTNQIVRIEPIFNPTEDNPKHKDIVYLKVHMTDGKTLTVEENFEDFYNRIRVSQAK